MTGPDTPAAAEVATDVATDFAARAEQVNALPSIGELLKFHQLKPTKALGQNFLLDLNLTSKIARTALAIEGGNRCGTTFEIGPGPGGLTRALLLADYHRVVALEKDERAVGLLASLSDAAAPDLSVESVDALASDLTAMASAPRRIVANLPYNIGTELVTRWLEQLHTDPSAFEGITVMLQLEVAKRLVATPGSKTFGRLSVLANWLCDVRLAFEVPASAFIPPPKVTSAIVTLKPWKHQQRPFVADLGALKQVTGALFGQRRKMVRQSVKALGKSLDTASLLDSAGINPDSRAEALSLADFGRLANAWQELRDR